jgi:allantoate deiminase
MSLVAAKQLVSWLDELGEISDDPQRLTRTFLSAAMRRANRLVGRWMLAAGLDVHEDAVGNLIGRIEGTKPGAKTFLMGSHLDTVRDAGRFDGALGVLLPILALAELKQRGVRLPFAVEVIGFSEEEGVRFGSAYLGSKGFTGKLQARDLALRDAEGISVREAAARWSGLTSSRFRRRDQRLGVKPLHRRRSDLLGYFEVHIEQGPMLENEKLAVGVVSAIAGQTRGRLTFLGKAGHAGTTPMHLRHDALAGAAEFIRFTESTARLRAPLVATVGSIAVLPGAPNVIAGQCSVSLDVRHPRDAARRAALEHLLGEAKALARRRGLRLTWERTQDNGAVVCSADFNHILGESVESVQGRNIQLVSGAGHDAVVMSAVTPVSMLFVRCREGLSHHPDEHASRADLEVALRVTVDFLERLSRIRRPRSK